MCDVGCEPEGGVAGIQAVSCTLPAPLALKKKRHILSPYTVLTVQRTLCLLWHALQNSPLLSLFHTHTHTHTHACTLTHTHTHANTKTHTHLHIHTHTHTLTHTHTHTPSHIHTHTNRNPHKHVHTYTQINV